jgi:uncharacterized RDD family membrane protein YckC
MQIEPMRSNPLTDGSFVPCIEPPAENPPETPGESGLESLPFEGKHFEIRAAAYVIDALLIYGLSLLFVKAFEKLFPQILILVERLFHVSFNIGNLSSPATAGFSFLVTLSYMVVFERICGGSLGKLILRMRVVQEDGSRLRLGLAIVRGVFRPVDLFMMAFVAYLSMKPPLYQRLGDKIAGTMVVSRGQAVNPVKLWPWRLASSAVLFLIVGTSIQLCSVATQVYDIQKLVISDADRVNLRVEDIGQFKQTKELDKSELISEGIWDRNDRVFKSDWLTVQSKVVMYTFYPTGGKDEASTSLAKALRSMDDGEAIQVNSAVDACVGDRGWYEKFVDIPEGVTGYGLIFFRKNVMVRLILSGEPGAITEDDIVTLAGIIDQRIQTGKYPPINSSPAKNGPNT